MKKLQTNQIVAIYGKPVTGEDFEGIAKLVNEYLPENEDGLSIWEVKFLSDGYECIRAINPENAFNKND